MNPAWWVNTTQLAALTQCFKSYAQKGVGLSIRTLRTDLGPVGPKKIDASDVVDQALAAFLDKKKA